MDTLCERNSKHKEKACNHCGIIFRPRTSTSKYCSRPCMWANNGGHNRGKGNGWINQKGYREIKVNNENKKEHRIIMEMHIGRKLLETEDVHHKNGDKLDNRISNLDIISHSDHTIHHNKERKYKKGYTLKLDDKERIKRSERAKLKHAQGKLMVPQARAALSKARGEA